MYKKILSRFLFVSGGWHRQEKRNRNWKSFPSQAKMRQAWEGGISGDEGNTAIGRAAGHKELSGQPFLA